MNIANQLLDIAHDIYTENNSFHNIYARVDQGGDGLIKELCDFYNISYTNPSLSQIEVLSSSQKVSLKKQILPIITLAVTLDEINDKIINIDDPLNPGSPKYSNITQCIDDLPNYFSGDTLTEITTNYQKFLTIRSTLGILIDKGIVLTQMTALTTISTSIRDNISSLSSFPGN